MPSITKAEYCQLKMAEERLLYTEDRLRSFLNENDRLNEENDGLRQRLYKAELYSRVLEAYVKQSPILRFIDPIPSTGFDISSCLKPGE